MKKSNEILLGDAIASFLKENHLETKLNETRLIGSWESVVGKLISRHTLNMYVKNSILVVKVDSAALRQELAYQKSKIMKKLIKAVGSDIITDIHFE